MQRSNANPCPHADGPYQHLNIISTSDGRAAILCDVCMAAMEQRIADQVLIRVMLKATMPLGEVARMRREQAEDYARRDFGCVCVA